MKLLLTGASVLPFLVIGGFAHAADATAADAQSGATVGEVIVTGTRQTGVKAIDSAAPIQVVGYGALKRVGQPDLIQALSQNLPSFNAAGYGADTAQLTLSAALRGLSPNDTLILVDGKRRHGTGNLAVDAGSPYTGAAAADLSYIPVGAVDHVEVLQDGAAAQYGTDAIAGVVNIILKSSATTGSLSVTGGQYYEGDGKTGSWSLNKGFAIGDKGFINVTAEEVWHGFSRQGGPDQRFFTPDGTLLPGLSPVVASGVTAAKGSPKVNNIYGDPTYNIYKGFYNAGYDIADNVQFYSFGSYGHRIAQAYENYRSPGKVSGVNSLGATVYPFPIGFSPKEVLREDDFSITGGFKGTAADWHWDLSTTYGRDTDHLYTDNSANPALYQALQALSPTLITPQTNFYDGAFINSEWTSNLDISREFDLGLASPLTVAFGGEARKNSFTIQDGEPGSVYGAGEQAFPGFAATDQGSHSRTNYAGYIDFAGDPIANLKVDLAGRYEHYSDFGDATSGKVTARYDFSPMFALRGTVSTGFRAPTLAEEYYSATNVAPSFAFVQLPANSAAAQAAGFAPLKPEKSDNYSIGFVAHPLDRLQVTFDAYEIDIRDRIINSNPIIGFSGTTVISQGVLNAIAAHGNILDPQVTYVGIQIFSNGANTRTRGMELTATYASDFGDLGHVDWSLGLNYNETSITKLNPLPPSVYAPPTNVSLLGPFTISALTTATPKEKAVLGGYWTLGKWSVNLRDTIYGPSQEIVSLDGTGNSYPGQPASALKIPVTSITDLELAYLVTPALKLAAGANNLFDHKAPTVPTVANAGSGHLQPGDGNNVFNEPDQFSPFGINGGYYYVRATYNF